MNKNIEALVKSHVDDIIPILNMEECPLGLCNGKLGWVIYLLIVSERYQRKDWYDAAIKTLADIYKNIGKVSSINLYSGLVGIGLGIDYIIKKNYASGNVNSTLKDIDNVLFKITTSSKKQLDCSLKIDVLFYFLTRIQDLNPNSENYILYVDLVIDLLNQLCNQLDDKCFDLPYIYTLDYKLPFLLYLLKIIGNLHIYSSKISVIAHFLEEKVLTTIPNAHSVRLYLMWGIKHLNLYLNDKKWNVHMKLLGEQIDLKYMIDYEFKSESIFFYDGVSSIYPMINNLQEHFNTTEICLAKQLICNKILNSNIFNKKENRTSGYFSSLINGYSSALFVLLSYENRFK